MKKLIGGFLLFVSTTVFAQTGHFVPAYNLNQFQINPLSPSIPFADTVVAGNIQIDQVDQQLKLTLYHHANCPQGAMCTMMMPAPTVMVLPIVHMGTGFCGGTILVAEQDLRRVDGGLTSLQIIDDNGNVCERGPVKVKRVQVTLTEQPARSNQTVVSTLSGFPY